MDVIHDWLQHGTNQYLEPLALWDLGVKEMFPGMDHLRVLRVFHEIIVNKWKKHGKERKTKVVTSLTGFCVASLCQGLYSRSACALLCAQRLSLEVLFAIHRTTGS